MTRAQVVFLGAASASPNIGDAVQLRVADGSWQHGFRAISAVRDKEVFVCKEIEWQNALKERRRPKGEKWPLENLALA